MLLEEDGYLQDRDEEDLTSKHHPPSTRGTDGSWKEIEDPIPATRTADEALQWWARISALCEHLEVIKRESRQ